jgi:Spy/CpxP family protein refolding chaperone
LFEYLGYKVSTPDSASSLYCIDKTQINCNINSLCETTSLGTKVAMYETELSIRHYLPKTREDVMKKHLFSRMVVVGAVVVLMGYGVNVYAGMGKGPGGHGMGTTSANLTDEQIKQMESERNAFQTATKGLRQQLNEKRQALQSELAKQAPDAATCAAIQKDISDLQTQFDQKRLTHVLEMKKIDPNFAEGRGMGPNMGHGMGPGKGLGPCGGGQTN